MKSCWEIPGAKHFEKKEFEVPVIVCVVSFVYIFFRWI